MILIAIGVIIFTLFMGIALLVDKISLIIIALAFLIIFTVVLLIIFGV